MLAIFALLLLGFTKGAATAKKTDASAPNTVVAPKNLVVVKSYTVARNTFERFYKEQESDLKNKEIQSRISLHKSVLVREASFMAVSLVLHAKVYGFGFTSTADKLRAISKKGLLDVLQMQEEIFRKSASLPGLIAENRFLPKEVAEQGANLAIQRCEKAVEECLPLLAGEKKYPLDPILRVLNDTVPIAFQDEIDRDRIYGPTFRSLLKGLNDTIQANINLDFGNDTSSPRLDQQLPPRIRSAVESLADQMEDQARAGNKPETMLIPHIRIKLDIIVAAYQKDMKRSLSGLYDQQLTREELETESAKIKAEVQALIYTLKRAPRAEIEGLFSSMRLQRSDIIDLEREVRAIHPAYAIVPPLT